MLVWVPVALVSFCKRRSVLLTTNRYYLLRPSLVHFPLARNYLKGQAGSVDARARNSGSPMTGPLKPAWRYGTNHFCIPSPPHVQSLLQQTIASRLVKNSFTYKSPHCGAFTAPHSHMRNCPDEPRYPESYNVLRVRRS